MSEFIIFRDTRNLRVEVDVLRRSADFDDEEIQRLEELRRFASGKAGGWILDSKIRDFVEAILSRESLPSELRVRTLRLLSICALRPDFRDFLALDRKNRVLMSKARDFESLSVNPEEQKALALLFTNLCSFSQGRDWLTYSYEWGDPGDSNLIIVSNVAALSLVSFTPSLQDIGSALLFNLALLEVKGIFKDDTLNEDIPTYNSVADIDLNGSRVLLTSKATKLSAATLSYAVLKYLSRGCNNKNLVSEEIVFRCLKALGKFYLFIPNEIKEGEERIPVNWSIIESFSERVCLATDEVQKNRK